MIVLSKLVDLDAFVGGALGTSDWLTLTSQDLADFGRVTRDEHWMHTDPAKAATDGPFGGVIAHGFLTLALVTHLSHQCYRVESVHRWVNYGLDRVRFVSPLLPGEPIRLELDVEDVAHTRDGCRIRFGCRIRKDDETVVMVASWIVVGHELGKGDQE